MTPEPTRGRDELALDALLARGAERERARARLEAEPGGARGLRALESELARASASLRRSAAWSGRREARFVARVLARTTRPDLSWRGDARLLLGFVQKRLRSSPALRVVAASLVLHLIAAPVVAYWVLRVKAPERRITLHVERPAEDPFAAAPPPAAAGEDELLVAARRREARENARAHARFVLLERAPRAPFGELAADAPLELVLLDSRARLLRAARGGEEPGAGAPARGELAPEELGPLALALWVERELDRQVLHGAGAPELGSACHRLARVAADAEHAAGSPGTAELVRAALARAVGLGACDGPPPLSAPGLLDADWFAALERAGREVGLAEASPWRAWLAWGGL